MILFLFARYVQRHPTRSLAATDPSFFRRLCHYVTKPKSTLGYIKMIAIQRATLDSTNRRATYQHLHLHFYSESRPVQPDFDGF